MRKQLFIAVLTGFVLVFAPAAGHTEDSTEKRPADALVPALQAMGIDLDDLGYRPKGYWPRYPHPATTPYVLPFFEDLLAEPLQTYEFTRTLGNVVEDWLTVERLTKPPAHRGRPFETLFQLGVALGTERRLGGSRRFFSHVQREPRATLAALARRVRGGGPPEGGQIVEQVDFGIPHQLVKPLEVYLASLLAARDWIDKGLAATTREERAAVFEHLIALSENTTDATKYFEVYDRVAAKIDEHSIAYGCLQALQATQNARRDIAAARPAKGWPSFRLYIKGDRGDVVVGTTDKLDPPIMNDCLLTLVLGPAPPLVYDKRLGATGVDRPLSVALIMQPDQAGPAEDAGEQVHRTEPELASGICGCGLVYAAGKCGNLWKTGSWGMGAGCFGMGMLVDEGGDDRYEARNMAQGAAYFGTGLLLDAEGDDVYMLREGDGQGFGGPGGIGVLADRAGNDHYYVERDPKKAGRADYHSDDQIASNHAQGAGFGRRGDISDGHNWAGGLGALLDVEGNDKYEAGNFSQGIGYWYGTGLLWDGGGDDEYRSVYFTQGSGAHFAIGALIDEGGNDRHVLEHNAGAGLGFGWDVVNAFLIDRGNGNDHYEAKKISIGVAMVRSNAFFLDEGGDDTYVMRGKQKGIGDVDERAYYKKPDRTTPMHFHLPQAALFLDLGGKDTYVRKDKDGKVVDLGEKDDATWKLRARDPASSAGFNVSIGRDQPAGRLGFLDVWPARAPKKDAPK